MARRAQQRWRGGAGARRGAAAAALAACVLAAALVAPAGCIGAAEFGMGSATPPQSPLRVCLTPYAPFVMNIIYASGNGTIPGPVPMEELDAILPDGVYDPLQPDFPLTGFDVEYATLVLTQMLGLNATFTIRQTYLDMYLAVRSGVCDLGVSAVELDFARTACDASCEPVPPGGYPVMSAEDYSLSAGPYDDADCCLTYGAPYFVSSFGLVSRLQTRTLSVQDALFSPHLLNVCLSLFLMMLSAAWVMHAAEGTLGVGADFSGLLSAVYWSITTMTTVGFGDVVPTCGIGRFVTVVWTVASYLAISTLTAIVTSLLTADTLRLTSVASLGDVKGTLCVESLYPLLDNFLDRSPATPTSVVHADVATCMQQLLDGSVQAVISDRPLLTWFLSAYSLPAMEVSPALSTNALSFVYPSASTLPQYIDPAVIASQTHKDWAPLREALETKYFAVPAHGAVLPAEETRVDTNLVVASAVLGFFTLAVHAAQMRGWLRPLSGRPLALLTRAGTALGLGPTGGNFAPCAPKGSSGALEALQAPPSPHAGDPVLVALAELRAAAHAQTDALAVAAAAARRITELEEHVNALLSGVADPASPQSPHGKGYRVHAATATRAAALESVRASVCAENTPGAAVAHAEP